MPTITCEVCKAKKANRPGKMCYACWVAAGMPTTEEVRGKAARDNAVPRDLSAESAGELAAMRWVTTHGEGDDATWEQRSAREFKEASPARFYERKARLEEAEGAKAAPAVNGTPAWDGKWPCPTCGHEPEKAIEDDGAKKVLALLAELDEREKVEHA